MSSNQKYLSETERKALIKDYFIAPMQSIVKTLVESNLTMSIRTEDSAEEK
ncbi:MAG: hypothetical protein MRK02_07525 [Candidatus Scalindua sp.]|nr:hypothetical protein [Candidatus Scalindua sp.]